MWYPAAIATSPAVTEPVSLDQAKRQCGVGASDTSVNDDLTRLIQAERIYAEKYCGILIAKQTLTVKCDGFADFARVAVVPVISLASIGYVDEDGTDQVLDPSVYELRSDGLTVSIALVHGKTWPVRFPESRITLQGVCGFDPVPADLVSGMLLRIRARFALAGASVGLKKKVVDGVGSREWDVSGTIDLITERRAADLFENYRCWALT